MLDVFVTSLLADGCADLYLCSRSSAVTRDDIANPFFLGGQGNSLLKDTVGVFDLACSAIDLSDHVGFLDILLQPDLVIVQGREACSSVGRSRSRLDVDRLENSSGGRAADDCADVVKVVAEVELPSWNALSIGNLTSTELGESEQLVAVYDHRSIGPDDRRAELERVGGHLDLVLLLPGEAVSHQGALGLEDDSVRASNFLGDAKLIWLILVVVDREEVLRDVDVETVAVGHFVNWRSGR